MMDSNLKMFLETFEDVRDDFLCCDCSNIAEKPVTFYPCCHMICSKHAEKKKISHCPACGDVVSKILEDDTLPKSVQAIGNLEAIFKTLQLPRAEVSKEPENPDAISIKKRKINPLNNKNAIFTSTSTGNQQKTKASEQTKKKLNNLGSSKENITVEPPKCVAQGASTSNSPNKSSLNKSQTNLEKRNKKGETALHVACRLNKLEKVQELLQQGANPNTKDFAGWTPLHEAVQSGNMELVELLLSFKAFPDIPGLYNETPLHEAIRYKRDKIALLLVSYGADLNSQNIKGETPLSLAEPNMKKKLEKSKQKENISQIDDDCNISLRQIELESENLKIYVTPQCKNELKALKLLKKQHNDLIIELKYNSNVTHIVVDTDDDGTCACSTDVLQAVASGKWIISANWVRESSNTELKPYDKYEVTGIGTTNCKGAMLSRLNRFKQKPGLFDGCHFYFANFPAKYEITRSLILNKNILTKLVSDAGGNVLKREPNPELIPDDEKTVPYHARNGPLKKCSHYIIFTNTFVPMYNMEHLKALPLGWLIESLEKYQLCDPW